jgi:hypothetical protein
VVCDEGATAFLSYFNLAVTASPPVPIRFSHGSRAVLADPCPPCAPCLLDMHLSHRVGLPLYEFDKPRLSGPDYLLIKRRD